MTCDEWKTHPAPDDTAAQVAAAYALYEALTKLLRQCERGFSGWPATLGEVEARNDALAALALARGET